jgi:hypothetical protein
MSFFKTVSNTFCMTDAAINYTAYFADDGSITDIECTDAEGSYIDPKEWGRMEKGAFVTLYSLIEKKAYDHDDAPSEGSDFEEHSIWNKAQLGL